MGFSTHVVPDYAAQRKAQIVDAEGVVPYTYIDTNGIASIGVGVNLREHGFYILQKLGFDIAATQLPAGPAREAERGYAIEILELFANLYAVEDASGNSIDTTGTANAANIAINAVM